MPSRPARSWLCLTAAMALGGCGFQPVYMPTASGQAGPAQREMATVFVPIIPDRPGQELRQALQQRLGSDAGAPAQYDLKVNFSVSGEGIGILTDTIATRIRFIGTANWTLIAHDQAHTVLAAGSARALDALNVFDSEYFAADLETEAAQKRLAETLATQITTRLAVWFREQAAKQAS